MLTTLAELGLSDVPSYWYVCRWSSAHVGRVDPLPILGPPSPLEPDDVFVIILKWDYTDTPNVRAVGILVTIQAPLRCKSELLALCLGRECDLYESHKVHLPGLNARC